ncbi:hypothetical protein P6P39_14640 [Clostridium perfringens]|nr:hypothetical protein [Clostridium perfringens]
MADYDNVKVRVVTYGFKGMDQTEGDTLFPILNLQVLIYLLLWELFLE